MKPVSQGFYGCVYRDGDWAIKVTTSAEQAYSERQAITWLTQQGVAMPVCEMLAPDRYRYPWISGQTLAELPACAKQAVDALTAIHQIQGPFFYWAGRVGDQWLDCFLPWVLSWFARLQPLMSGALYQQLSRVVTEISSTFAELDSPPVVVHGDPHPENILLSNGQVRFIDPGITGFAPPELDWAMYVRPGFHQVPSKHHRSITLMRILLDAWHWQRTSWRDEPYMQALIEAFDDGLLPAGSDQ